MWSVAQSREKKFVGDFVDGNNRFKTGAIIEMAYSQDDLEKLRKAKGEAADKKAEADKKSLADKAKLLADMDR